MPRASTSPVKEVVYLFGAGATQAEADHLGTRPVNLLMRDDDRRGEGISNSILRRAGADSRVFATADRGIDIEKLISLLSASAVDQHTRLADTMRRLYFDEIRRRLVRSRIIQRPRLATALLEMHRLPAFRRRSELLTGILTTNHDGLLQLASHQVHGAINVGFPCVSPDFSATALPSVPLVVQLHGSFTWTFGVPIAVVRLRRSSTYIADTTWLPPAIVKDPKNYPFNRLASLAYACLAEHCDVLRVVGSSLTQNDWNVLSLIFNAQRHRETTGRPAFRIELIMPHEVGLSLQTECAYLSNLTSIGFLTDGDFDPYKDPAVTFDSEMSNPFGYWLKEKISHHHRRGDFGVTTLPDAMASIAGAM